MKKVLILTHGNLSEGFTSAMRVISGVENDITALCIQPQDSIETINGRLEKALNNIGNNLTILLTDVPFGSTTQIAIPFLEERENLHIVTGCNLALVMGILMEEFDGNVEEKIRDLVEQSKSTVSYINDMLLSIEE